MVGGSNGGHNTKMMVEDYPGEYDGGLAGYGITSHIEWMGSNTRFLRNFDVFASRIADIVAKRTADPNWDPDTTPLSPPLTAAQLQALLNVYTCRRMCAGRRTRSTSGVCGLRVRWGPEPAVAARPVRRDPRLREDVGREVRPLLRSGWRRRSVGRRNQGVGPEQQPAAGRE